MNYEDFVLHIKSDSSITSTFQGKSETSELKLSEDIIKFKDKLATPGERITKDHVMNFGENLRKALFKDKIGEQFNEAMSLIADKHEFGVRILLEADPPFADYPWETMSYNGSCLATDIRNPIVRIFSGNNKVVNLKDKLPKILFLLSNVGGEYYVDTAMEMEIIGEALPDNQHIAEPKKIDIVTRTRIKKVMSSDTFNIIHFVGHGIFEDNTGYLALRGEDNKLDKADEDVITALFQNAESLGLVILNACSTAQISNNFTGLVPKLLRIVPAVIAMRQPISNTAATTFVRGLYSNLLSNSIEVAMQNARNDMSTANACNGNDFSIPVLYLGWRNRETARKIFVRSYDETEMVGRAPQSEPPNIVQSLNALYKKYSDFEELVNTILAENSTDLFSKHHNLWNPAFRDLKEKYELTIKEFCSVFLTSKNTLLEKSEPLIHKLDGLSISIKNGSKENIEKSWKEVMEEYVSVTNLFSRIMTLRSEVN